MYTTKIHLPDAFIVNVCEVLQDLVDRLIHLDQSLPRSHATLHAYTASDQSLDHGQARNRLTSETLLEKFCSRSRRFRSVYRSDILVCFIAIVGQTGYGDLIGFITIHHVCVFTFNSIEFRDRYRDTRVDRTTRTRKPLGSCHLLSRFLTYQPAKTPDSQNLRLDLVRIVVSRLLTRTLNIFQRRLT
jgi:hypothetical protein